jgi:hypothetical protein
MRGHACELSILFVREVVGPCPHLLPRPFRSRSRRAMPSGDFFRASLARRAAPFGAGLRCPFWGAVTERGRSRRRYPPDRACARSEAENSSMGRAPRVKDTRAGIGAPMRGGASVPLLERVSSTLCHHAPPSSRLDATSTRPERDQGHRSCASPRRSTLSRWSGCLGRIVSTCAETEIALPLRPTDLFVTRLGCPNVASEEASAFFATRLRPLLTRKAQP